MSSSPSSPAKKRAAVYLQQLEGLGVRFRSYTEPYLSTENELVSHILLGVLSYFAEYGVKKISRRTKAEMKRRTGLAYNTVKKYLRRIESGAG